MEYDHTYSGYGAEDDGMSAVDTEDDDDMGLGVDTEQWGTCWCGCPLHYDDGEFCPDCGEPV